MTEQLLIVLLVVSLLCLVYAFRRLRGAQRTTQHALDLAQQSERRFSESFHTSPIPLALSNLRTNRIAEVNNAYVRLIDCSYGELVGRSLSELGIISSVLRATLIRRTKRSGLVRNFPTTLTRKDGQHRDVVLALDYIEIDGDPHMLTTVVDQTDHKRAVAALQSSDERMRELTEAIDEVFWVSSPDRLQMLYISPAYEKVWGRPCATVMRDAASYRDAILEDDLGRIDLTPDLHEYEYRIRRPDGTVRWIRTREFPVRDDHGEILRLAGVSTDVTEQRLLEEQLRQAQKMESLGMLAGGIAHDFNNLLAVISSCSGLLSESIDKTNPDRELVEDISDAVVRASALTRQLLSFSRKHVAEAVVLDPNLVVTDTRKLLRRIMGVHIDVVTSLEPDLRAVRMDRGQLVQVLLNLAVNARDAMPKSGTLSLATRNVGDTVVIDVIDTGTGMAPEVVARACEPFYTTKEQGMGTGMGLAVVHGIVDLAGGKLEIDSRLGVGTTFRVYLPAFHGPAATPRAVTADIERGVETILIVDDDDYVRRATARALRGRGYTVVEASNGRAALVALPTGKFDLMLTDIVMPGMNGRVLAEAARARFPDLKVLMMTGYTDDEVVRLGVARGEVDLIEKPFTIPALAAKVRSMLDAEDSREQLPLIAVDPTGVSERIQLIGA